MTVDHRRLLAAILLIAVSLRVALALYWGNAIDVPPLLTDQRSYHALGERLLAGAGFSFGVGWYPFTPPDTPTAHWSFLQSLYIAAIYGVAGPHPLATRLVTAVLGGILLPLAVYALARRWQAQRTAPSAISNQQSTINNSIALTAAFLAAIYPYFVLYAATLMTETFYIVALLWSLERALALRETLLTQRRKGAKARRRGEQVVSEVGLTQRRGGAEEKREKERMGGRVDAGTEESKVEQTPISQSPNLPISPSSSAPLRASAPLRQNRWLLAAITLGLSLGVAALLRQSILPWVVVLFAWLAGGDAVAPGARGGAGAPGAERGRAGDGGMHRAGHGAQLWGLRRVSAAQFQCGVCHVLGAASAARDVVPGVYGGAAAHGYRARTAERGAVGSGADGAGRAVRAG